MRLLLKYVLCSNQPLGLQSLSINWFLYDTRANFCLAHIFMLCLRFAKTYLEFFFFNFFQKRQIITFICEFLRVGITFILLWDVQTWVLLHVTLLLNIHTIMFYCP